MSHDPFCLTRYPGIGGVDAVRHSWAGAKANLGGVFKFVIVNGILTTLAALACYLPAFFLLPVTFAATHVLFEDIYGRVDG